MNTGLQNLKKTDFFRNKTKIRTYYKNDLCPKTKLSKKKGNS